MRLAVDGRAVEVAGGRDACSTPLRAAGRRRADALLRRAARPGGLVPGLPGRRRRRASRSPPAPRPPPRAWSCAPTTRSPRAAARSVARAARLRAARRARSTCRRAQRAGRAPAATSASTRAASAAARAGAAAATTRTRTSSSTATCASPAGAACACATRCRAPSRSTLAGRASTPSWPPGTGGAWVGLGLRRLRRLRRHLPDRGAVASPGCSTCGRSSGRSHDDLRLLRRRLHPRRAHARRRGRGDHADARRRPSTAATPASRAASRTASSRSPDRLTTPARAPRRRAASRRAGTRRSALVRRAPGRDPSPSTARDAVAAISSARATNEENYLLQKLMRAVIGTQQRRQLLAALPRALGGRPRRHRSGCRAAPTPSTTSSAPTASCSPGRTRPRPTRSSARGSSSAVLARRPARRRRSAPHRARRLRRRAPAAAARARTSPSSTASPTCCSRRARRRGVPAAARRRASTSCASCSRDYTPERVAEISGVPAARPAPGGRASTARPPAPGDRLRPRRHRARARHRRRAHAGQPGDPDRQRRHRATAAASIRCAARTTSRAPRTWARCRTCCPATSRSPTTRRRGASRRPGACRCGRERGLRIPEMFDAALDGRAQGALRHRRGHRPDRPRHRRTSRRRSSACELVVSPGDLPLAHRRARRRGAARGVVPREGRHVRQLRPPLPAGPPGACPARGGAHRLRHPARGRRGARRRPRLPHAGRGDGRDGAR